MSLHMFLIDLFPKGHDDCTSETDTSFEIIGKVELFKTISVFRISST